MRSYDDDSNAAHEAQISAWNRHLSTSGDGGYSGTARELFEKVDAQPSVDDRIDARNRQRVGGKDVVTDDDVKEYIEAHPLEQLGMSRVQIEKLIRDERKRADGELVKAKIAEGTRASENRVRAAQIKEAATITDRLKSPQAKSLCARLERAYDRRDVITRTERTKTHADTRERDELAKEIITLERRLTDGDY